MTQASSQSLLLVIYCALSTLLPTGAFLHHYRRSGAGLQRATTSTGAAAAASSAAVSAPTTEDLVKIFGRLAEKKILLDSSAGTCCHSGCDGCPYRYDFDILRAARPKWLPSYSERVFDREEHRCIWRSMFDGVGGSTESEEDLYGAESQGPLALTWSEFETRLAALPYSNPLGAPIEVSDPGPPSPLALQWFWKRLVGEQQKLTVALMNKRLTEWAGGEDSLMFSAFSSALLED